MKRNFILLAASLLTISGTVFAAKPAINTDTNHFSPVAWQATMQNGGFSYHNNTKKMQYVQVTIETGSIGTYKLSNGHINGCEVHLESNGATHSTVCELQPNDTISADLDFASETYASGTYQVEMEK